MPDDLFDPRRDGVERISDRDLDFGIGIHIDPGNMNDRVIVEILDLVKIIANFAFYGSISGSGSIFGLHTGVSGSLADSVVEGGIRKNGSPQIKKASDHQKKDREDKGEFENRLPNIFLVSLHWATISTELVIENEFLEAFIEVPLLSRLIK